MQIRNRYPSDEVYTERTDQLFLSWFRLRLKLALLFTRIREFFLATPKKHNPSVPASQDWQIFEGMTPEKLEAKRRAETFEWV